LDIKRLENVTGRKGEKKDGGGEKGSRTFQEPQGLNQHRMGDRKHRGV
jgi:hypothetical protein